jgi:hypothetical protein
MRKENVEQATGQVLLRLIILLSLVAVLVLEQHLEMATVKAEVEQAVCAQPSRQLVVLGHLKRHYL